MKKKMFCNFEVDGNLHEFALTSRDWLILTGGERSLPSATAVVNFVSNPKVLSFSEFVAPLTALVNEISGAEKFFGYDYSGSLINGASGESFAGFDFGGYDAWFNSQLPGNCWIDLYLNLSKPDQMYCGFVDIRSHAFERNPVLNELTIEAEKKQFSLFDELLSLLVFVKDENPEFCEIAIHPQ